MIAADADVFATRAAAYVHIPFCSAVCPYCDFAVVAGRDDLVDRYVDAVIAEIGLSESWRPLESVYFGGGTPSHVAPALLARVLDALSARHGIADRAEISLEANPEDFSFRRGRDLRRAGFNRVSFGAQSFDQTVLASLGRRHDPDQISSSMWAARIAGFSNVSLDLIFGTPGESEFVWNDTLGQAIAVRPDHVSCYSLTVEKGTPLGRAVAAGAPGPDQDAQAEMYESAQEQLGSAGLSQYEVSNWSKPGHECRYNLTVWAQGEYEAYGNGAHGHRKGIRFRNVRRVDAYLEAVESGQNARAGLEQVEGWDSEIERLFVGLRRTVGVADGPGVMALLDSEDGKRLEQAGIISHAAGRLQVVRPLLTDEVHRSVLGLDPPRGWAEPSGANIVSEEPDA